MNQIKLSVTKEELELIRRACFGEYLILDNLSESELSNRNEYDELRNDKSKYSSIVDKIEALQEEPK